MILPGLLTSNFSPAVRQSCCGNALGGRRGAMIGGGDLTACLSHFCRPFWYPCWRATALRASPSAIRDVISSGLVLGHAFQNNWLFVALFIVFVAALAWFVKR